MSKELTIKVVGTKEFEAAINRNPKVVANELKKFFVRSKALYTKTIIRSPWQVGGSSGGAPVATGALRDSHQGGTRIRPLSMVFGPNTDVVTYAKYVHGRGPGEINSKTGVKSRPWLNHAFDKNKKGVEKLASDMLTLITKDLAK